MTPCRWTTNITEDQNLTPGTIFHLFNILKASGNYMYHKSNIHKSHILPTQLYSVIRNDCWGFNNLSYTIHLTEYNMYFFI
jgi:hypothetical protein